MYLWYTIRGQRSVTSIAIIFLYVHPICNRQSCVGFAAKFKCDFVESKTDSTAKRSISARRRRGQRGNAEKFRRKAPQISAFPASLRWM